MIFITIFYILIDNYWIKVYQTIFDANISSLYFHYIILDIFQSQFVYYEIYFFFLSPFPYNVQPSIDFLTVQALIDCMHFSAVYLHELMDFTHFKENGIIYLYDCQDQMNKSGQIKKSENCDPEILAIPGIDSFSSSESFIIINTKTDFFIERNLIYFENKLSKYAIESSNNNLFILGGFH